MTERLVERVKRTCVGLPETTVDNVFGEQTNVYRICNKMFALVNIIGHGSMTVKTTPEESKALRSQYDWVRPGYYSNKRNWVTVDLEAATDPVEIDEMIEESYRLVVLGLPKRLRSAITSPDASASRTRNIEAAEDEHGKP